MVAVGVTACRASSLVQAGPDHCLLAPVLEERPAITDLYDVYVFNQVVKHVGAQALAHSLEGVGNIDQSALIMDGMHSISWAEAGWHQLLQKQADNLALAAHDFFAHDDSLAQGVVHVLGKPYLVMVGDGDAIQHAGFEGLYVLSLRYAAIWRRHGVGV